MGQYRQDVTHAKMMPPLVRTNGGICFHIFLRRNEREVMSLANLL